MVVTHKHMYPGTTIQRTVMLYHGLVFLFDRLSSDREHDYDFVYRNAGRMTLDVPLAATGRPMGRCWGRLCADAKAIYTEDAPPKAKGPCKTQYVGRCLIVRRRGKTATFFTLLEPYRGQPRVTKVEPGTLLLDGRPVASQDGTACRLVIDQSEHLIMMCPLPGVKAYGGIRTRALFNATEMGLTQ